MVLVEPQHLEHPVSNPRPSPITGIFETHLLRTPPIDDVGVVFRLLAVLPVEEYDQLPQCLVLRRVDALDVVLPRPRGRLPRARFGGARWGRRVRRVPVPAGALVRCRRGGGLAAALLRLGGLLRLLDYLLDAAMVG